MNEVSSGNEVSDQPSSGSDTPPADSASSEPSIHGVDQNSKVDKKGKSSKGKKKATSAPKSAVVTNSTTQSSKGEMLNDGPESSLSEGTGSDSGERGSSEGKDSDGSKEEKFHDYNAPSIPDEPPRKILKRQAEVVVETRAASKQKVTGKGGGNSIKRKSGVSR